MTSQDRKETTATRNLIYATGYAVPTAIRALIETSLERKDEAAAPSGSLLPPLDVSSSTTRRSWNI